MIIWAVQGHTANAAKDSIRILIVDDDEDITTTLRRGLEKHGYSVDSFNDAKLAFSAFKPNVYSQVLLDIRMPGMNGFDLAHKIWSVDEKAQICLSAFEIFDSEASKVFTSLKTKCFIKKPISTHALVQHVASHMRSANNA